MKKLCTSRMYSRNSRLQKKLRNEFNKKSLQKKRAQISTPFSGQKKVQTSVQKQVQTPVQKQVQTPIPVQTPVPLETPVPPETPAF